MQTATASATAQSSIGFMPILGAALIGLMLIVVTGQVQAAALHDAAHDTRHATGMPCH